MKVSHDEFAHTLRSMRPSLAVTVEYVEEMVKELEDEVASTTRKLKLYCGALKRLNDNPERFR